MKPKNSPSDADKHGARVVLVTGAGSGIGRATAIAFAKSGDSVVLAGRTEKKLQEVADEITPAKALVALLHHEQVEMVTSVIDKTIESFGRLDVLVNNAGAYIAERVADTSEEQWREALDANLTGPFLMTKAAIPHLRQRTDSAIINVASTLAEKPIPGAAPYSVAKAGLVMLTRATALEEAAHGIRVNAVCPGVVDTPIHRQRVGDDHRALDEFFAQMDEAHPLGRIGRPEEIAALIVFLASSASTWTTGAVVPIDGGISLV